MKIFCAKTFKHILAWNDRTSVIDIKMVIFTCAVTIATKKRFQNVTIYSTNLGKDCEESKVVWKKTIGLIIVNILTMA